MKTFLFAFFALFSSICFAQNSDPKFLQIQDGVTIAMQRNFEACNAEDVRATMNTCSLEMPGRDLFEREMFQTFRDKDIHYSLRECELLQVKFPYALARIVQDTIVEDRSSDSVGRGAYRNSSALLPEVDRVEYLNTFKYEQGEWKLLVIVSEMKKVK